MPLLGVNVMVRVVFSSLEQVLRLAGPESGKCTVVSSSHICRGGQMESSSAFWPGLSFGGAGEKTQVVFHLADARQCSPSLIHAGRV